MQFRMTIPGVVGDNNNLLAGLTACLSQLLEKFEECFSIESGLFASVYKFTVVKPDGAKIATALTGWLMVQNRVAVFWCYPHTTSGAMLLKMNFVDCPQIHTRVGHHFSEFFLCFSVVRYQLLQ